MTIITFCRTASGANSWSNPDTRSVGKNAFGQEPSLDACSAKGPLEPLVTFLRIAANSRFDEALARRSSPRQNCKIQASLNFDIFSWL